MRVPRMTTRRWVVAVAVVLVIGFSCGLVSAEGGQSPPPLSDPLGSLKKEVDEAYAAFSRANDHESEEKVEARWQAYMRKTEENSLKSLEAVKKAPKSAEALAALDWIVSTPRNLALPYGEQAIALLLQHHSENPNVGPLCSVMAYYGNYEHHPTLAFLRKVSDKNPDRSAHGQATLGLARLTWQKAQYLDFQKKGDSRPLTTERPNGSSRRSSRSTPTARTSGRLASDVLGKRSGNRARTNSSRCVSWRSGSLPQRSRERT